MAVKFKEWVKSESCPKGVWLSVICECNYMYKKRTFCNREDCLVCGQKYSNAHWRRYMHGLKYIIGLFEKHKKMGYMVITTTKELRLLWRNKEALMGFARYIKRLLERELKGVSGVERWHFGGDKDTQKIIKDVKEKEYSPHLNILFTCGYINKDKLKKIKKLIEKRTGIKVVYYRYTRKKQKVLHWWRYVSRPTFLLQEELTYDSFLGMKNVIWFGKYRIVNDKKMTLQEFVDYVVDLYTKGYIGHIGQNETKLFFLFHNRCYNCGRVLKWWKFYGTTWVPGPRSVDLGCGYWVILPKLLE